MAPTLNVQKFWCRQAATRKLGHSAWSRSFGSVPNRVQFHRRLMSIETSICKGRCDPCDRRPVIDPAWHRDAMGKKPAGRLLRGSQPTLSAWAAADPATAEVD